jgi:hypothetical protein
MPDVDRCANAIRYTYNRQIGIERILVLSTHDLIQIIGRRETRGDMIVPLEYGDIRVSFLREMVGCGEAKRTTSHDKNRIRLGDAHGHFARVRNNSCRFPWRVLA